MKYWETFFLTVGAGLQVGAAITPSSWFAIPLGLQCTIGGIVCTRKTCSLENEHRHNRRGCSFDLAWHQYFSGRKKWPYKVTPDKNYYPQGQSNPLAFSFAFKAGFAPCSKPASKRVFLAILTTGAAANRGRAGLDVSPGSVVKEPGKVSGFTIGCFAGLMFIEKNLISKAKNILISKNKKNLCYTGGNRSGYSHA